MGDVGRFLRHTTRLVNSLIIGEASLARVVEGGGGNARKQFRLETTSFSSTRARIGGRVRLPGSWRYLAKARLQPPVEIGDEIMKAD